MKSNNATCCSLREAAQKNRDATTVLVITIARALSAFRDGDEVRCHSDVDDVRSDERDASRL